MITEWWRIVDKCDRDNPKWVAWNNPSVFAMCQLPHYMAEYKMVGDQYACKYHYASKTILNYTSPLSFCCVCIHYSMHTWQRDQGFSQEQAIPIPQCPYSAPSVCSLVSPTDKASGLAASILSIIGLMILTLVVLWTNELHMLTHILLHCVCWLN